MAKSKKPRGLITNETGPNQLLPLYYPWAWESFIKGCANDWRPSSIPMLQDVKQWNGDEDLSREERHLIKRCLGFFAGSESLVSNNLLLSIFRWITNAECRQYILRQAFEESLHNHTVVYVCESLGLDYHEVYEAFANIDSVKAKDDFLMGITSDMGRPDFNTDTIKGKQELLRNIITYYIICEGIMFYAGFAMLLTFGRQNKIPGIAEQIQYTMRDEVVHINFGVNLINQFKEEFPKTWTKKFQDDTVEHIKRAVDLEIDYARDVLPHGILGLNSDMFILYSKYIANRRLQSIGLDFRFDSNENPFPWMSEIIELDKNKNFFERKVTNYQQGTLENDL